MQQLLVFDLIELQTALPASKNFSSFGFDIRMDGESVKWATSRIGDVLPPTATYGT